MIGSPEKPPVDDGSNVDPDVKQNINKQGWEGNAAVLIGKEGEEMKNLEKRLESEGKTNDLETYIRMH